MTKPHTPQTSAPVTHRTPVRPGQPGADGGRRSEPNSNTGPAQPPYSPYEPDTAAEADAIKRDSRRPSTSK